MARTLLSLLIPGSLVNGVFAGNRKPSPLVNPKPGLAYRAFGAVKILRGKARRKPGIGGEIFR